MGVGEAETEVLGAASVETGPATTAAIMRTVELRIFDINEWNDTLLILGTSC